MISGSVNEGQYLGFVGERQRDSMKRFMMQYLKQQKKVILAFLLFCIIYTLVILLYQLPFMAVLYPLLLCSIIGTGLMVWDMYQNYKRYCSMQELLPGAGVHTVADTEGKKQQTDWETDPEAVDWELLQELLESQVESDSWENHIYREMLGRLLKEQRRKQDVIRIRQQDTVDYYTTWMHQIKTPIAAMGLILQQEDTENSRRLSEELQRIEQYVEMVLTYLRLGSEETDYVFAWVELDSLLRGCIRKYAGSFIRKRLTLDYESMDCRILTDEKWLAFVVEQLMSNALKYTREGSVSIYLEAPCTLCIRDTGIGIAPEDLPRIFEKGYTGYNGRNDKKATGLGMYLCKQICDRLKHTITAESVLGEGTTMRIRLDREVLETE